MKWKILEGENAIVNAPVNAPEKLNNTEQLIVELMRNNPYIAEKNPNQCVIEGKAAFRNTAFPFAVTEGIITEIFSRYHSLNRDYGKTGRAVKFPDIPHRHKFDRNKNRLVRFSSRSIPANLSGWYG